MRVFNMLVAATAKTFATGCNTDYSHTKIHCLVAPAANSGAVYIGDSADQSIELSASGEKMHFPGGLPINFADLSYKGTADDRLIIICE